MTDSDLNTLCCGQAEAVGFCSALLHWAHAWDDLHDRDHPPDPSVSTKHLLNFVLALAGNPFFKTHAALLTSPMASALGAWRDSELWRRDENGRRREAAQVLKSQYQDALLLVALLTGGTDHYLAMCRRFRGYDWEL